MSALAAHDRQLLQRLSRTGPFSRCDAGATVPTTNLLLLHLLHELARHHPHFPYATNGKGTVSPSCLIRVVDQPDQLEARLAIAHAKA